MGLMEDLLPRVRTYLDGRDWRDVPCLRGRSFEVSPLAQGEYNLNYRITAGDLKLVFRINVGTQIQRSDQIVYEYRALKLLEGSGVTPKPHFVDDSRRFFDTGILIMKFLPGEPLDYRRDTAAAAALFARVHQVDVPEADNHLIRETAPLSLIWEECAGLLQRYFESEQADAAIRGYLQDLLHWADAARSGERYYQADPWPCIVNTEVNSGNFIVNRLNGTIHLVDWEMPRWGTRPRTWRISARRSPPSGKRISAWTGRPGGTFSTPTAAASATATSRTPWRNGSGCASPSSGCEASHGPPWAGRPTRAIMPGCGIRTPGPS